MISISVRSKKYDCDITLRQKVTVVRGHSGRGKTVFTKAVADDSGAYSIDISDKSYEFVVLYPKNWYDAVEAGILKRKKRIYVIDDSDFFISRSFTHLFVQDELSFYIIINRFESVNPVSTNTIPYSVNEIYEFCADGKSHTIKPYYNYPDVVASLERIDDCITEDSNSGFEFFKELYKKIHVDTTHSKDKVLTYLVDNISLLSGHTIFLAVDLAAFGSWYEMVYEFLCSQNINTIILKNYNSFEYMLLCSNMFKFDFDSLTNEDITSKSSFEVLCETIIEHITSGKFYRYTKSSLNMCYASDCCYQKRRLTKDIPDMCDRGLSGSKFDSLLLGTEFETLLLLRNNI